MSSPTPEQWSAMGKLVQSFYQRPDTEPFREPVDWQTMGLFDYPKIIKKPMDLGTVKKNIVDRKYKTLQEAADDVRLVWVNCMTYNADGSDFYNLAQVLQKKWNEKYKKLLDDFKIKDPGVTGDSGVKATLDEKRAFAKALYKITKEDLGRILVEVEKQCPAALTRNSAEDEVEFNVDKIPGNVFQELQQFLKTCAGASSKPKKKASNGSGSGGGGAAKRQKTS